MTPIMKARHQAVKGRSVKDDARRKMRWYLVPLTIKLMRQVICHRVLNDNLFNLVKLACSLTGQIDIWARSYQRFSLQAAPWSGLVLFAPFLTFQVICSLDKSNFAALHWMVPLIARSPKMTHSNGSRSIWILWKHFKENCCGTMIRRSNSGISFCFPKRTMAIAMYAPSHERERKYAHTEYPIGRTGASSGRL